MSGSRYTTCGRCERWGTDRADAADCRQAWIPAVCGALVFALTLGMRESQGLFIGPINTAAGLGIGAIRLAFGVA
jgi:hypothetical protein